MELINIVKFISGSAILMAGLTYLLKKFIDKVLDSAVERYKITIQHDLELYKHNLSNEAEKLKFELNKISLEYQIKYNALYKERGDVIKEIYVKILNIEEELTNIISTFQGPEWKSTENNAAFRDLILKFENEFESKRLYFSLSTCNNVELLIKKMNLVNNEMYKVKLKEEANQTKRHVGRDLTTDELLDPLNKWRELEREASTEIRNLRRELEREFSKLIGVE